MFEGIKELILRFWEILGTPIAELSPLHLLPVAIFGILIFFFIKYTLKLLSAGWTASVSGVKKMTSNLSASKRASKITCNHCGRTLDKCLCNSNKGLTNAKRIKKYKAELKERRKQALAQLKK